MTAALITGATGGLGTALSLAFAEAGYDVALHHRDHDAAAAELADRVRAVGARALTVSADLSLDGIDEVAGAVIDRGASLGGLRVVVLNASSQELTPWDGLDASVWDRLYANSLRHTAALIGAAGQALRDATDPVVVVIGSIEGLRPAPAHAAYAVFKAATHHLVAAAAAELGPAGVRVVGVAPGLIDRPGLAEQWPDGYQRWCRTVPLQRPVTATEVAAAAVFLASAPASGITGVTLPVDAGWSAAPGW